MTAIARIVTRDGGDDSEEDGLVIGLMSPAGRARLKPGHVYEIHIVDLVEVGPSWIKATCGSNPCCWSNPIGAVMASTGPALVLSEAEHAAIIGAPLAR